MAIQPETNDALHYTLGIRTCRIHTGARDHACVKQCLQHKTERYIHKCG